MSAWNHPLGPMVTLRIPRSVRVSAFRAKMSTVSSSSPRLTMPMLVRTPAFPGRFAAPRKVNASTASVASNAGIPWPKLPLDPRLLAVRDWAEKGCSDRRRIAPGRLSSKSVVTASRISIWLFG